VLTLSAALLHPQRGFLVGWFDFKKLEEKNPTKHQVINSIYYPTFRGVLFLPPLESKNSQRMASREGYYIQFSTWRFVGPFPPAPFESKPPRKGTLSRRRGFVRSSHTRSHGHANKRANTNKHTQARGKGQLAFLRNKAQTLEKQLPVTVKNEPAEDFGGGG